ncbi:MAG TPA: hypothetical protein DCY93_03055, partial [Firmicutes bacterium]|nr:hypothetical protein [Bacillota bacterium]
KYKTKDLPKIYSAIKSIREKEKQLKTKMYQYPFVFGAFENINIRNYDFEDFETRYLVTKEIINKFINYFDGYTLLSLIDKVKNFTLKGKDQLLVAGEELFKIGQIFSEKFKFDFSLCDKYFISLEKLLAMSQKWTDNIDYLSNWCLLLKTIATAQENSLNEILNVLYNTEDLKYDLELIYKKSIYYHIITQEISADKNGTFNSVEIKQNIED